MWQKLKQSAIWQKLRGKDCLKPQDLNYIRRVCWKARSKWFHIGLELDLKKSDLDALQKKCEGDIDKCFTEMLDKWLNSNPRPTIADLITALRGKTIAQGGVVRELEVLAKQTIVYSCQTCNKELICSECNTEDDSLIKSTCISLCFVLVMFIGAYLTSGYVSPDCYATGKGLKIAKIGETSNVILYANLKGIPYTGEVNVTCDVIHESSAKFACRAQKINGNRYQISYLPLFQGNHQLHIKVEGEHIKGSPFNITVTNNIAPSETISEVVKPWDVAVNKKGEIIVVQQPSHWYRNSITIISNGKMRSLNLRQTPYLYPRGVAVDDHGYILLTGDHGIAQLTEYGRPIRIRRKTNELGKHDEDLFEPNGIAFSSSINKIAVADGQRHRVQIFNQDLTHNKSIGSVNRNIFTSPQDVAFDTSGNLYVTDMSHNPIKVFNPEGNLIWSKSNQGRRQFKGICIDRNDIVYVVDSLSNAICLFTNDGKFLTSFGRLGSGPGQFVQPHGIAVDYRGNIYVADTPNNRIQVF